MNLELANPIISNADRPPNKDNHYEHIQLFEHFLSNLVILCDSC